MVTKDKLPTLNSLQLQPFHINNSITIHNTN